MGGGGLLMKRIATGTYIETPSSSTWETTNVCCYHSLTIWGL